MRWPAEWEPHQAVWIGFPGNPAEWPDDLVSAQAEVAAFADAVADEGQGERVLLVCRTAGDATKAEMLTSDHVEVITASFGDIWLRDTGVIVTQSDDGLLGNDFGFNGWGGKFDMVGDGDIGLRLAEEFGLPVQRRGWILEGGAIDGDGAGRLVTTQQCVLNVNRNEGLTRAQAEERFARELGTDKILWLGDGLQADHTDGHVDNLARFVESGVLALPEVSAGNDPNITIFADAVAKAQQAYVKIVRLPSVGEYRVDGEIAPASYMNFYIGNTVVAVPQYGASNDAAAVKVVAQLFPDRKVTGLSSRALLRGGGSFHCISQQIPIDISAV